MEFPIAMHTILCGACGQPMMASFGASRRSMEITCVTKGCEQKGKLFITATSDIKIRVKEIPSGEA